MTQWGLDTLFNPAKRHMDEEKRRLQSTREEVGDNSGGRRIDLESGKVRIARTGEDADDAHGDGGGADGDDGDRVPETDASAASPREQSDASAAPRRELSPAALRAARRRGRQPR